MATEHAYEHHGIPNGPPATQLSDPRSHPEEPMVSPRTLWFGFVSSAISWVALGCLDLLITWRACIYQEDYGLPSHPASATALYLIASLTLLVITIAAGVTSYRNWRAVSDHCFLINSHGVERTEFMALLGVIVSVTLGIGIVLLALPPFFLSLCWRAR